jgi:hypothetical protein
MVYSEILNLGHTGWKSGTKQFFSDRPTHVKFTLMLNAFQELGLVEYKGGKTKLLEKGLSIQMVL